MSGPGGATSGCKQQPPCLPRYLSGLLWAPWDNLGRVERGARSAGSEMVQTLARPSLGARSGSAGFYSIWPRCLPGPCWGGVQGAWCQEPSTKRVPGLKVTARPQGPALPTPGGFRGRATDWESKATSCGAGLPCVCRGLFWVPEDPQHRQDQALAVVRGFLR